MTTKPSSPFLPSALALAAALLMAACGGGDAEPPPVAPPVVVPDTTPPTVGITDSEDGTSAPTTDITFSFTFSEDVGTSFEAKAITVTGGKKGEFTRVSGTLATLVVTPAKGVASGTVKVDVAAGAFSDAAGNLNAEAASAEQAFGTATGGTGTLLTDFDEAKPPVVTEFGGAGYAIEAGPDGGDGNAVMIQRDGGDVFAGAWVATARMPFSDTRKTITARVYSPTAGTPMVVKVEYGENMGTGDTSPTTAVVAGWQTLTWVFNSLDLSKAYVRFTMLPNLGTVGTGQKYYFDDITVLPAGDVVVEPPAGTAQVLATFDEATPPGVFEFGGAGYDIKAGPKGGKGKALEITRPGGEPYAGAYVATAPIAFSATRKTVTARVYSPTAGTPMVAKAEFAENEGTGEVRPTTAVVAGWQTLTWVFDNADPSKSYTRFVILPNLGTVGTGQVYYIDDIQLLPAAGAGADAISYIAQPFTENVQSAYDPITAKARTGNYTTGSYAAPGTLQWWGGAFKSKIQIGYGVSKTDTTQSYYGLYIANGGTGWDISKASTYYFNLGTNGECAGKCTANVRLVSASKPECVADVLVPLSSAAAIPYSRKLTDFKVSGCTTNTMAAFKQLKVSELHFQMLRAGMQFSAAGDITGKYPNGLDMGDSIGFDAPTGAPPTEVDEVISGPAFTSLTFDDPDVTYVATPFEGLSASIVKAPAGGTGKALKANKLAGAAKWAGVTISTGVNISIDKIPFTATAKKLTLRVWAPAAGMTMRMKVEDATDVTHNCETDTTTTVAKGWQTLTFDFNTRAFNNGDPTQLTSNRCVDSALLAVSTMNKVSVFPNFGTEGAVNGDFYFDDLKFTGN